MIESHKYDTAKLADMGYGDCAGLGATVELTERDVEDLAISVDGTIDEIESARID